MRLSIEYMEQALSPDAFDRAWPPSFMQRNSSGQEIWYFSPAGERFGYGTALTQLAAENQRQRIRGTYIKSANKAIWC